MKNNSIVEIIGFNHNKYLSNTKISPPFFTGGLYRGKTTIFFCHSSMNVRLLLFSHLDTYFCVGVVLLRLIGRYLYAQEGRPLLNTKKVQITHT